MKNWLILILIGVIIVNIYAGEKHPLDQVSCTISSTKPDDQVKLVEVSIDNPQRLLPAIYWEGKLSGSVALDINKADQISINEFEQAKFTLGIRTDLEMPLRRIVLRLQDKTGETFQVLPNKSGKLTPGLNQISYNFDTTDPQKNTSNIWGGNNNKKVDWPLTVRGIAIDISSQTPPNQKLILDTLDIQYPGEQVEFSVDTGYKFNLLLPDHKESPVLVVRNIGDQPLELSGSITIRDAGQDVCTEKVSGSAPVDGEFKITLPGDYSKQNAWNIDCKLTSSSGKEFSGFHRFARMNPAGPTPGRAQEFLFGVCGHPPYGNPRSIEKEAEAAGLCGAKIFRTDFHWRKIQPQRDKWDFSNHDQIVDAYWRNGVEMEAILAYSVPWAEEVTDPVTQKTIRKMPPNPQAYANYAREVANRYKDRIKYYETWNEPDLKTFAKFPAEAYMELQRGAYDAIKKVQPDAKIMNGGITRAQNNRSKNASYNPGILDQLIADGRKHFDLLAYHCHGSFARYADDVNILRDEYKFAGVPWYSNETAESSNYIGDRKQAGVLFQKLLFAWSEGAMGYNWYVLRKKHIPQEPRRWELITPEFEPKPVYVTYNMLANTYKGGKFLRRLDFTSSIYACLFENQAQEGLLALWGDRISKTLVITGLPVGTTMIDLFGNEEPLPTQNGIAMLQVSDDPFSLRIPDIHKQNIQCAGEIFAGKLPKQLAVPAGGTKSFTVTLKNPLKQALNLTFKAEATEKLSVAPTNLNVTIPAGRSKDLQIQLKADQTFHATPLAPGALKLSLATAGLNTDASSSIPVICRTSAEEPLFQLDKEEQYYSFIDSAPGNEPWYWKGPDDLSAKVYLTRNNTNLQLKIEVRDDVHVQPFTGVYVWKGDNVQLGIQLPGQNGFWKLGLTRLADGKSEVYCWSHPQGFSNSVASIKLDTQRDETQKLTTYNATIPFNAIGMTSDMVTEGFLFNLVINDNDDNKREGFIFAMPGLGARTEDPQLWSVVNL